MDFTTHAGLQDCEIAWLVDEAKKSDDGVDQIVVGVGDRDGGSTVPAGQTGTSFHQQRGNDGGFEGQPEHQVRLGAKAWVICDVTGRSTVTVRYWPARKSKTCSPTTTRFTPWATRANTGSLIEPTGSVGCSVDKTVIPSTHTGPSPVAASRAIRARSLPRWSIGPVKHGHLPVRCTIRTKLSGSFNDLHTSV